MPRKPLERFPDTHARWALVVEPYNKIRPVLLANLEYEMAKGMGRYVLAREDAEMYQFVEPEIDENLQSNPRRDDLAGQDEG